MRRCPSCRERLPADPERRGARCPYCREPLQESRRRRGEEGQCAVHPENTAAGTCQRCGNYTCQVCDTLWQGRWLCPACVELALERKETVPGEARAHLRCALLGLGLGVTSWLIVFIAVLLAVAAMTSENIALLALVGLVLLSSPMPSILGVAQSAAAVQTGGDHMVLATMGLVLNGLHAGASLGLIAFSIALNS
jgi:hypothetical protein